MKSLRSGLKIRARSGYFALPPEANMAVRAFETPLLNLLSQPILPHDLQLESRILQLGESQDGDMNSLVVEVPISTLETHDDPNTNLYTSHVSILAEIKDKSGEVVQHFAEDIPQHGALDQKQRNTAENILLERHFVADPGEYTLEVAVLDNNSGKAAGQRSTFQIADASQTPFLSDLSLVAHLEPLPQDVAASEPFRYGDARITPDLSGQIPKGTKQITVFSIIHPDLKAAQQPKLEIRLIRNGKQLAEVPLELRPDEQDEAFPYLASIGSSSLPAGSYQVIEALTQSGTTTEKSINFQIPGPEFASADIPDSLGARPPQASDQSAEGPDTTAVLEQSSPFVITALPAASVTRPSPETVRALIDSATKYALHYSKSLPNFVCIEATKRSAEQYLRGTPVLDAYGQGNWKTIDHFSELLRYNEGEETRTLVEMNGQRTSGKDPGPESWISVGQFGGLLTKVFLPTSKTSFQWESAAALGTQTVQVLRYVVSPENATMDLRDGGRLVTVGFHGLVYVDAGTGGIRRITLEANNAPHDFAIRSSSMMVDYNFVTIGTHDYLLPVRAAVSIKRGNQRIELNEIEFRDYRRFASQTKILPAPASR